MCLDAADEGADGSDVDAAADAYEAVYVGDRGAVAGVGRVSLREAHKPLGLVCSHDGSEGPSIYTQLPERWRRRNPTVTSIGRLDKETSGLLLVTDQSALVHRLTSPKHKVPKVYRATLDREIPPNLAGRFASGTLQLEGEEKPCAPAELTILSPREADLTLIEGRYHQVRRMFAAAGLTVLTLHRTRFGSLELGDLPPGQWRELPLNALDPAGAAP